MQFLARRKQEEGLVRHLELMLSIGCDSRGTGQLGTPCPHLRKPSRVVGLTAEPGKRLDGSGRASHESQGQLRPSGVEALPPNSWLKHKPESRNWGPAKLRVESREEEGTVQPSARAAQSQGKRPVDW